MNEKNLLKWYWAEATNTAVYLMNKCPDSGVHDVTPHEKFLGRNRTYHMSAFLVLAGQRLKDKWEGKTGYIGI